MKAARTGGLAALLLASSATAALACPACAGRAGLGAGSLIAMGAMIALPFAVVAIVVPSIRRTPTDPPN